MCEQTKERDRINTKVQEIKQSLGPLFDELGEQNQALAQTDRAIREEYRGLPNKKQVQEDLKRIEWEVMTTPTKEMLGREEELIQRAANLRKTLDEFKGIEQKQDKQIIFTTMPRGLAAAVLATTPAVVAVTAVGFSPIVFGVIIFSNVIATLGIFFLSGERPLGPGIVNRVKTTWEKLNAPEEELKKIEKKEKKEKEKTEKKKEEEAKEEAKKEAKEETKKEVKQIKNEVKKEEKDLKKLEKKIEKVKDEKEQKPL